MTRDEMRSDEEILGRTEVDDAAAITDIALADIAAFNADPTEVAHAVADQAEALFTWDYTKAA